MEAPYLSAAMGQEGEDTFTLMLPIVVPRPRTDSPENAAFPRAMTGIKVLVVDDNGDAADAMQMLLSHFGHDASAAHSGPAALALLAQGTPRAIIIDLRTPGMDGFELARCIRERASLRSVVLIALSGYGQLDDIKRSREAGFEHHLIKPADPAALLALLDSLKPLRPQGQAIPMT
ncbi:response regulator [Pararobbsia alpina]|nr:response regulator [Pararobbsia alpina]